MSTISLRQKFTMTRELTILSVFVIAKLFHRYGLEIPVKYKFVGPEKAINWMKTQVNKKVNDIVKNTEHCMS